MRVFRLQFSRLLYLTSLVCICLVTYLMILYTSRSNVYVTKAIMDSQQEARARVLHYYNPKLIPHMVLAVVMEDSLLKNLIYNNTMTAWTALMPTFTPVLYVTNETSRRALQVKQKGWVVRLAPRSDNNLPIIKNMIQDVMTLYPKTPYFGYASTDLLFDESLIFTIKEISKYGNIVEDGERDLIFQNRTKVFVGRQIVANVYGVEELRYTNNIRRLGYDLLVNLADDKTLSYFVATRDFRWDRVPDLVAIAPESVNWLLAWSLLMNYNVYDVTNTALVVQQTDSSVKGKKEQVDSTLCD